MNPLLNGTPPVVVSISEFDSSGGAGIISDLKSFSAHQCYGLAAVTALSVQDAGGKRKVQPIPASWLKESILSLFRGRAVAALKVGGLGSGPNAKAVAEVLAAYPGIPVVLDPSLSGANGSRDKVDARVLRDLLLVRATVVTPNVQEAAALTGLAVESPEDMKAAAARLVELGADSAVVTGASFDKPLDVYSDRESHETFMGERVKVEVPHGVGSVFSSAIAANLALGRHPHDAVMLAKAYITESLRKAFSCEGGPVLLNHFYRMQQGPRPGEVKSEVADPTH